VRIVFFGTPELALPSLEAISASHEITAVVCQPDKPKGRSKKLLSPPTKVWAEAHHVHVSQPTKLNDGVFEAWLRSQAPDICTLVAYGRILKQAILDVPPHGFLNMHPSLLPRYRGPSPIQTALLEGQNETGITIMRLDAGTDTGDILLQESMPISIEDTSETLSTRLAQLGAKRLLEALNLLESGDAIFKKQDDALATHSKMYTKEDGRIRWDRSATEIHNLARAFNPWPVAHCLLKGDTVRIYKTRVIEIQENKSPGTVLRINKNDIVVAAGDGAIAIETIQTHGKRAIPVADFLRGNALQPGDRFEDL